MRTVPRLADILTSERLGLWAPVAVMAGIGVYFALAFEPPGWVGAVALLAASAALMLLWHHIARPLAWALALAALGFSAAQWRAASADSPLLTHELRNRIIEATIVEIEPMEKKQKLVLSDPVIEDIAPEETPRRLRISFRLHDVPITIGDRIRFTANLYPLPAPTMPGGYDFARHFYFQGIGGSGFAFGPPVIIEHPPSSGFFDGINRLRLIIGEDMRARIPGATGAVAAAMTMGETGPIPEDTEVSLRDSGLAHMLSISGLHLAIAAGILFFAVRLLLSLYPPLALRIPAKKIAALFALAGAAIYLLLAGTPIPAQRAFIMVAFLFCGILIDRRGITLHTLMLAALFLLLLFPDAMLGASFQMSFAATLAIVALYDEGGPFARRTGASWWAGALHHLIGIVLTSLAATLATSPFVLFHFNRFALFGLLSNMVVIPLATFVIMPGVVLSLLLMPLGIQGAGYALLAWGTEMMLHVSVWVTALPYASLYMPSPTQTGVILAALGILWTCLTRRYWRLLGVGMIALGMATSTQHTPVDVFIGDTAKQVMVRLPGGEYTMLKGSARSFRVETWLRSEGLETTVPLKQTGVDCDKTTCLYEREGRRLIFVKKPLDDDALRNACATAPDMLIAWRYGLSELCPQAKQVIGRDALEAHGAHTLRFTPSQITVAFTRSAEERRRIWQPDYAPEESPE